MTIQRGYDAFCRDNITSGVFDNTVAEPLLFVIDYTFEIK